METQNLFPDNKIKQMPRIISIEGNIGVGKTTIIDNLAQYYKNNNIDDVIILREPVDVWTTYKDSTDGQDILTKFYIDPKKYCFPIQILVLKTMLELLVKTIDNNPNCKLIICERSILSSRHVFTKMLYESSILTEIEYKIYESLFDEWVNSKEFTPQKIVYLNISPEISYKRILKRSRVGENIISLDYIISCGLYHHYWLYSIAESIEILTIECDNDVTYNLEDNQNEGC
jgi:deoxyadenosine/deoxycytidine kinase